MRPIKFRAKHVNDGSVLAKEWVFGDLLHTIDGVPHIHQIETDSYFEIIPETVGQFTGLFDKNGKEIYEGDMVKWGDQSNGRYWRFAVVQLAPDIQFDCASIQQHCGITNSSDYTFPLGIFTYRDTHNWLETIGNIHDNPELLKTK